MIILSYQLMKKVNLIFKSVMNVISLDVMMTQNYTYSNTLLMMKIFKGELWNRYC